MAIISPIQFSINKTIILHHFIQSSYNKISCKGIKSIYNIVYFLLFFFISVKILNFPHGFKKNKSFAEAERQDWHPSPFDTQL
jgi:hypothetical protein